MSIAALRAPFATLLGYCVLSCQGSAPQENHADAKSALPQQGAVTPAESARDESAIRPNLPTAESGIPAVSGAEPNAPTPPWAGPFLAILETSAGIFEEPSFGRQGKIGYAIEGARIPVLPDAVKRDNCREGWYEVVGGGYLCASNGTLNLQDPRVKNGPRQPDVNAILPYRYARNGHNGTPLYRTVPTPDQIRTYEAYRFKDQTAAKDKSAAPPAGASAPDPAVQKAREDQQRRIDALRDARRSMLGDEAAKKLEAAEAAERTLASSASAQLDEGTPAAQWWEAEKPEVDIGKTYEGSDEVLSRRMVKGFYIAIERQFEWNGRSWYRSTKGEIAPSDRLYEAAGPKFHGVELNDNLKLPLAWVYGASKERTRYEIDPATHHAKAAGSVERFEPIALDGEVLTVGKTAYVHTQDGFWMRQRDVRVAALATMPADLSPNERWVDVNLSTQTVVLYQGTTPVYATLTSSGKESDDKEKDHRTPTGEWRIREKHLTATMDGDGTVAGELPYSIEAVPYVMYFNKSYALHGAFWHQNFGVRMSHGCVNLAPLDAKYIFFHTDPPVSEGWSGAFSVSDRPGSRVVVHE